MDWDVVVIGAGVAGLTALSKLKRAGLSVICLEARDRIGGRISTVRDPLCPIPIELGAEFVHGRPPETWEIVAAGGLAAYDCGEHAVHIDGGSVRNREDAWLPVHTVMEDMRKAAVAGPDVPFATFIRSAAYSQDAKELATSFVQGFNAARAEVIGIASLAQDSTAAAAIDGDRSFRIFDGYDAVPAYLAAETAELIHLHSVVEALDWRSGAVSIRVRSAITGKPRLFKARAAVVTVPLGVLQAKAGEPGFIRFDPEPSSILEAAGCLRFGDVVRTILRFRERVWEQNEELADAGFLLSREPVFPTWWTPLPFRIPVITGWSAGPKAEPLLGKSSQEVVSAAVEHLGHVVGIPAPRLHASLESAYFHDWHADPFARGAYSYAPAGALKARSILAEPVEKTLFFAGEASETEGHSATVHGAIATGSRAARQVLDAIG